MDFAMGILYNNFVNKTAWGDRRGMSREEIFRRLNEVFRDVFDDNSIEVTDQTVAGDIEGWDSLAHIGLIVSVERSFGIKFKMGEVSSMKNVGAMVDIIAAKCP